MFVVGVINLLPILGLDGGEILKLATKNGGKKLQAFGEGLFKFYTKRYIF